MIESSIWSISFLAHIIFSKFVGAILFWQFTLCCVVRRKANVKAETLSKRAVVINQQPNDVDEKVLADNAAKKNKGKPRARPQKNPEQILAAYNTRKKLELEKIDSYNHFPKVSYVTTIRSCCMKSLDELMPITIRELKVPMVHTGKFLTCRIKEVPYPKVGVHALIEDINSDLEELALYNFTSNTEDASWIQKGMLLIVKEPHLQYDLHGIVVRVDSPSDVIFVDEVDKELLEQAQALVWYEPEKLSITELMSQAHELVGEKNYEAAIKLYRRAVRLDPNLEEAHLGLARALFNTECHFESYEEAEKALCGKDTRKLALTYLGNASYEMRFYEEAAKFFRQVLIEYPDSKYTLAIAILAKCKIRIHESLTGEYNWVQLNKNDGNRNPFDMADFIGPVEVVNMPGKGMGLVAAKDITKGTLLLAVKAFIHEFHDSEKEIKIVDTTTGIYCTFDVLGKAAEILRKNPALAKPLYSLYAGEFRRDVHIPFGVIESGRIKQICRYNLFGNESNSKLYILPSFSNHSCCPNTYYGFYGDMMLMHAVSDLKKGEEITLDYRRFTEKYKSRCESLESNWGFTCKCKLCVLDSSDPLIQEREIIIEKVEKLGKMAPELALKKLTPLLKSMQSLYVDRKEYQVDLVPILERLNEAHLSLGNYEEAIRGALKIFEALGSPLKYHYTLISTYQVIVTAYIKMGKLDLAKKYAKEAFEENHIRTGMPKEIFEENYDMGC